MKLLGRPLRRRTSGSQAANPAGNLPGNLPGNPTGNLAVDLAARTWRRAQRATRRWALRGVLIGGLLGGLLFAPATWLAQALSHASAERLLLADATGSVWHGSAVLVLQGGAGSHDAAALPGRLHWSITPAWGGAQVTLQHACCLQGDLQIAVRPGLSGVTLQVPARPDGIGQWPARWLVGLGTPWNTLQLGGSIRLSSDGLTLLAAQGKTRLSGALVVQLVGASSRISPIDPLGNYRFSVRGDAQGGDGASLVLDTAEGALRLSGTGLWTGSGLRFRGEARAAEGFEVGLSNLLNIIGRRQGALSVISIG